MKLIGSFISLLILLTGLLALAASSPEEFLKEQKLIRIYVDKAPGFGHQSAGVSVMRRLRDLGYTGEFEVIYQPVVAAKIQKIYPGFPQGIPHQVRYVAIQDYQNLQKAGKTAKLPLAISGADDGFGGTFAKIANADTYLRLQPLGWGQSAIYQNNPRVLNTLDPLPLANLPTPDSTGFAETLKEQKDLPDDKKAFALKFAELAPDHFSFPVYGVGVQAFAAQRLYFYGKAVKSAAQKMNSNKAVVVPVISPFNEMEMDTVMKTFGKVPGFEGATSAELKHQKQMHLMTPEQFAALPSVKPGNVYFVFVGLVPQNLYNFFYEQSTLPVWVAGKNAMSFATSKGKVYFNTVNDYHLPSLDKLSPEASKLMNRAYAAFSEGFREFGTQYRLNDLSKFIQLSSTPGTELNSYYTGIGTAMSKNDKVMEGLRNVIGRPSELICEKAFAF